MRSIVRLSLVVLALILGGLSGNRLLGDESVPLCYATRGDEVILSRGADRWVTPASVQKVLVAAVALHHLGPEYRFTTRLGITGPRVTNRISGDLVIHPGADPTWNQRFRDESKLGPWARFAQNLHGEGVRVIEGDVIVDLESYGGRPYPLSRPLSELSMGWGAPPSPLRIDDGIWKISVRPGEKVGDPVRVASTQQALLVNRAVTVSSKFHRQGSLEIIPWWGMEKVLLRGEYPISEPPYQLPIASPHPNRDAAEALVLALREAGVEVLGEVKLVRKVKVRESMGELKSPPLREILIPFLRDSLNPYAGQIGLALALEVRGQGRFDWAVEVVQETLDEVLNGKEMSLKIDDLSGLSPYNLVTPRSAHEVLRWALNQEWKAELLKALPGSGEGTLQAWPDLPPRTKAKTGTLHHAMSLAGVLDYSNGDPTVFACFLSQDPRSRSVLRKRLSDEVWIISRGLDD